MNSGTRLYDADRNCGRGAGWSGFISSHSSTTRPYLPDKSVPAPNITFMMFFGIQDFAGKKHSDSGMQSGPAAQCREMRV